MLFGRVETLTLLWPNVYTNSAEMRTEVRLIDPFHRVKEVGLVFLPKDSVPAGFQRDKDSGWPALPGGQLVSLKIEGQKATGNLRSRSRHQAGPSSPTRPCTSMARARQSTHRRAGCAPNSQVVASPPANQPTPGTSASPAVTGTPPPGWKDVGGGFKKEGFFVWLPIDGVTDDRENP